MLSAIVHKVTAALLEVNGLGMHELNIIFMRMENFEIQSHELCVDRNFAPVYFC
jgi:hypothetical protein